MVHVFAAQLQGCCCISMAVRVQDLSLPCELVLRKEQSGRRRQNLSAANALTKLRDRQACCFLGSSSSFSRSKGQSSWEEVRTRAVVPNMGQGNMRQAARLPEPAGKTLP